MTAVAETRGCSQEACQPPPEAGRGNDRFSSTVCRSSPALPTPPFQTSDLRNWKRINSCCVCPVGVHCLYPTVTASPGLCTQQSKYLSGVEQTGRGRGGVCGSLAVRARPGPEVWIPSHSLAAPGNILEIMPLRHFLHRAPGATRE